MRKFVLPCFFVLFALMLSVNSSFADKKTTSAKKDLSGIKQKIKSIKKELSQTKAKHSDVADALKDSEVAISKANKKLREIKQKQKQNKSTLSALNKRALSMNSKLAEQQKLLGNMLYQQYAQGNQSYAQLILQNKNPNQIARDIKYQSYIAKAHTKLITDMQAGLEELKTLNLKTTAALKKVASLESKQKTERKALTKQKLKKATVLKKLSNKIAGQRGEIKKLKRDEKRLSNLVKKLAKISKKRTKKTSKKRKSKVIAKNKATPDNRYAGKKFSSLKGKLKLPVRGEVMNRYGKARPDSGVLWKGLFIRAKEGADVKSVASGRVVFAEWMRGFGNLIIVDHGRGYMSLYGNNQSVLKDVGQVVKGGDTIASVGNSGGNASHGVYYELRRKSIPFDPLKWSKVR